MPGDDVRRSLEHGVDRVACPRELDVRAGDRELLAEAVEQNLRTVLGARGVEHAVTFPPARIGALEAGSSQHRRVDSGVGELPVAECFC